METTAYSSSSSSALLLTRDFGISRPHRRSKAALGPSCNVPQGSVNCRLADGSVRAASSSIHGLQYGCNSLGTVWGKDMFKKGKSRNPLPQEFLGICFKCRVERSGCGTRFSRQLVIRDSIPENIGERPPIWGIQLMEGLAVGMCPRSTEDFEWMANGLGADTMLCLEDDAGCTSMGYGWDAMRQRVEALGGVAVRVPMKESDRNDQASALPEAVRVLGVLLGAGRSVYVCSASGARRAPLTALSYLIFVRGIARDQALHILKSAHKHADPPLDCLDNVRARMLAEHGASVNEMARKVYEGRMETGQPGGPESDWKEAEDRVVTRVFQDAVESRLSLVGTLSRASVGALTKKIKQEWKGLSVDAEESPEQENGEPEGDPALSVLERIRKQVELATAEAADAKARTEEVASRAKKLEEEVHRLRRQLREARGGSAPDMGEGPRAGTGPGWDPGSDWASNGMPMEPEYLPSFISGGGELLGRGELDGADEDDEVAHPHVNGVEVYETGDVPSSDWSGQILDLPAPDAEDFSIEALVNEGVARGGRKPPSISGEGQGGVEGQSAELASRPPAPPSVENDEIVFRLRADAVKAAEDYEEAKRRADRLAEEVEEARRFVALIKFQAASSGVASPSLTDLMSKETDIDANLVAPAQRETSSEAPPAAEAQEAATSDSHSAAAHSGGTTQHALNGSLTGHEYYGTPPQIPSRSPPLPGGGLSQGVSNGSSLGWGGEIAAGDERGGGDEKALVVPVSRWVGVLQTASVVGLGVLVVIAALQLRLAGNMGPQTAGRGLGTGEAYTERVVELEEKVSDLGASLTIAMEARAMAEADMASLQAEARELDKARDARLAEDARVADKLRAELAGLSAQRDRVRRVLEVQLAEATGERDEARARLGEVRSVAEELRRERDELVKRLEAKTGAEMALRSEVAGLQRAVEGQREERVALEKKVRDINEEEAKLRRELESTKRQLAGEVQKVDGLKDEVEGVRRRMSREIASEARLKEEIQDIKRKGLETESLLKEELEGARRERESLVERLEEAKVERSLRSELEERVEKESLDVEEGAGTKGGLQVAEAAPALARRKFF